MCHVIAAMPVEELQKVVSGPSVIRRVDTAATARRYRPASPAASGVSGLACWYRMRRQIARFFAFSEDGQMRPSRVSNILAFRAWTIGQAPLPHEIWPI